MNIKLGKNAYGKNAVNLSKINRVGGQHIFRHISVNISLSGDFKTAHTVGDNSHILPTDTQKNTVYALAKDHFTGSVESFALRLAAHFIENNEQLSEAKVSITEYPYQRISPDGNPHPTAFLAQGPERHTTTVTQTRENVLVKTGISDLLMVKTAHSGFENYIHDQFTTLKETADRIMATNCMVAWKYEGIPGDFTVSYNNIRNTLLKAFADHHSLSLQHTLYFMGEAVLQKFHAVKKIRFKMPNKHHILVNLEPFGMRNENEIFMATDEPYGYITATVGRE